jgi:thiamine biosynthesis lipoprotein
MERIKQSIKAMKKILKNFLYIFPFYFFLFTFFGCSQNPYHKNTQLLMGTYVEVISDNDDAPKIAFEEIRRLENFLSKFKPDSEISKLNKLGSLKVSSDTLRVMELSLNFYNDSAGAFDITVSPLADIWKNSIRIKALPKQAEINSAKKLLGSEKIIIDKKNSAVKFLKKGIQVDLGGVAKGYAVDCAVKKLKAACLINAGGNMFAIGKKGNKSWKIGISHPRKRNKIIGYMFLEDSAIATSGDCEQYFEINNQRFSHIIDPETGYPVNNNVVSVTVVSDDATTCDALSTAIFVLGKAKGKELAKRFKNTTAVILSKEDLK